MPKILVATLCDDVREEVSGKVSLMGTFNQFRVADFRNPMPPFWIFARMEFEQEGDYPSVVEFRTTEGQTIFQIKGVAQLRHALESSDQPSSQARPVANLKFRVDNLRLPRHGFYELAFIHNNHCLQAIQIEVVVQPQPYVQ